MHDGDTKPVGIYLHIGRVPIFVAGNVRSGGDIGQLNIIPLDLNSTPSLFIASANYNESGEKVEAIISL